MLGIPILFKPGPDPVDLYVMFGVKLFLTVWIIFVPIVITARLDKIIKLLQDKK